MQVPTIVMDMAGRFCARDCSVWLDCVSEHYDGALAFHQSSTDMNTSRHSISGWKLRVTELGSGVDIYVNYGTEAATIEDLTMPARVSLVVSTRDEP